MRPTAFLPVVLSASIALAGSGDEQVLRDLGPGKKLCICGFHLRGAAKGAIPPALLGVWGALLKEPKGTPYSEELSAEFLRVYEQVLGRAGAFQLSPSDELRAARTRQTQALDAAAKENGLFACVSADSVLGVAIGWKKKVNVITEWQLTGPSGWEIRVKTKATSEQEQGMFPDTTDPLLKPVFLQLARESARKFLEELAAMMKKGGSAAEIDFAAADQAVAGAPHPSSTTATAAAPSLQQAGSAQRFADNGDGTVTDTLSGLMWAAKDNGGDVDWAGAKAYCEGHRAGGHSDWRMPTAAELHGLFDANESRRAACGLNVDVTNHVDLTCARVWSSDSVSSTNAQAALFDLEDTGSILRSVAENMRALPVRSATSPPAAVSATPPAAPVTAVAAVSTPAATANAPTTPVDAAPARAAPATVGGASAAPAAGTAAAAAQSAAPLVAAGAPTAMGEQTDRGALHPVKLDRKWGYVDSRGDFVIPPQFDSAARFSEGRARVSLAEEVTVKDRNAAESKTMHHKYGWVDEKGRVVVRPEFERADDFSEGLAPAGRAVPRRDAMVKVTRVFTFENGALTDSTFFESRFDYIDETGNAVLHTDFEEALPFAERLAAVSPPQGRSDQKWGFMDRSGKIVIPAQFRDATSFSEGLAAVSVKDKWGYIDRGGATVLKPKYDRAMPFAEGLAAVEVESKWGYIDRAGALAVPARFEQAASFAEGLAPVRQGQTWGFIDKTGAFVVSAQFELARTFAGGVAAVKSGGKWGFVDRAGKFVVAPRFEDAL